MSQPNKPKWDKEIFSFKKTKTGSTQMKLNKGVKIFIDNEEVDTGEHGNLFLTKIEDEIAFINERVEEGKLKQESADKQLDYLAKKQEYGFTSVVKAKTK